MESLVLAKTSEQRSKLPESQSKSQLISDWLCHFALNAGQALTPDNLSVFRALWLDAFEDLPYGVLEAAFKRAIRVCKFWPLKVADVREHVDRTKQTAISEAADLEWQRVLELRRLYWNPDMPGGFSRGMPYLSEHVQAACRAAGVFREVSEPAELHVWSKKRFIESYLAWEEIKQDQYLLPDGELKSLLADFAATKALPPASAVWSQLHARGLEYAKKQSDLPASTGAARVNEGQVAPLKVHSEVEIERQKKILQERGFLP
jgi:hypothetical protein